MIASLPLFHTIAGRPVIVLGEGAGGEARARLVARAGGVIAGEDCGDARLAFVALAEPDAAAARLRARGLLVNVADRPDLCDFVVPAILDRDPVLIAVGTGGASAGLAKAIRLRLESLLPQRLGSLARALEAARGALRRRFPDATDRRRALDQAMAPGGPLDPLREHADSRVESWLAAAGAGPSHQLFEIRLRSPDPDDLTLREARVLGMADLVAAEPAVPAAVLSRARADARRLVLAPDDPPPRAPGLAVVLRAPR